MIQYLLEHLDTSYSSLDWTTLRGKKKDDNVNTRKLGRLTLNYRPILKSRTKIIMVKVPNNLSVNINGIHHLNQVLFVVLDFYFN